jgi:hypothetical protein
MTRHTGQGHTMRFFTLLWTVALIVMVLVFTSCAYLGRPNDPGVRNLSSQSVSFHLVDQSGGEPEQLILTLEP